MDTTPTELNENNSTASVATAPADMTGSVPASPSVEPATPKKSFGKKKLLLAGIVAGVVLLGGSAAAYFGAYVPNQPDNVWASAIKNSGKGYQEVVSKALDQYSEEKTLATKGTMNAEAQGVSITGTFETKTNDKNANIKAEVTAVGNKISVEAMMKTEGNAKYPDTYIKVSGIKDAEISGQKLSAQVPGIVSVDGQWYKVPSTQVEEALKSIEQQAGTSGIDTTAVSLTAEDAKAINKAITDAVMQNLFTENADKSVLQMGTFVGKEDREGRNSYHYSVAVNRANLKDMLSTLKTGLASTKLKELLNTENMSFDDIDVDGAVKSVDEFEKSTKIEAWVDAKTKVMRAVRFIDAKNGEQYIEFALDYNGSGDEYPFVMSGQLGDTSADRMSFSAKAVVNAKSGTDKLTLDARSSQFKLNSTLDLTMNNDAVSVDIPSNTKSIDELMTTLGIDPSAINQKLNGTSLPSGSSDSDALQKCLEAGTDLSSLSQCDF